MALYRAWEKAELAFGWLGKGNLTRSLCKFILKSSEYDG